MSQAVLPLPVYTIDGIFNLKFFVKVYIFIFLPSVGIVFRCVFFVKYIFAIILYIIGYI